MYIQDTETLETPKKTWVKPDMEIVQKNIVQLGSIPTYPESVPTIGGLFVGSAGS